MKKDEFRLKIKHFNNINKRQMAISWRMAWVIKMRRYAHKLAHKVYRRQNIVVVCLRTRWNKDLIISKIYILNKDDNIQ